MALLEIRGLTVDFATTRGPLRAVDSVDLDVAEGEVLGVVGESGSGKSVSMLAVMGLLASNATITAKSMTFDGRDLMGLSRGERRKIVGKDVAMIFQEPTTSLNPCFTVGDQIVESLKGHMGGSAKWRRDRAVELLNLVGIPDPGQRAKAYPHQLSGGMNQRVMIAMAIACEPRLLIADEPTTALDVTIQAQIMDLLARLQRQQNMAMVLITHDMAVVSETAQRVQVMYAGQLVEQRPAARLFDAPSHPYTAALLASLPEHAARQQRLPTIPGMVPGIGDRPVGCLFSPRCGFANARCRAERPGYHDDGAGGTRCHTPLGPNGQPEVAA